MRFLDRLIGMMSLAGLMLLSSCGGGVDAAVQADRQASPGTVVGQPPPSASQAPVELRVTTVAEDAFSGVREAKNVVVRDADALAALWAEHSNGRSPAPLMPSVNFSAQMVVAVFAGHSGSGCRQIRIDKISLDAGKLVVSYEERDLQTFAICTQAVSSPMVAVTVARTDAAVQFVDLKPVQLAFRELDRSSRSLVAQPKNVVVRDAAALAALWAEHGGPAPLPQVDFQRHMVIGVFAGSQPNGCHSTAIDAIARAQGKVTVARTDTVPGPGVMCTLAIVHPAHIVMVERSDAPVEFTSQVKAIQ
ncbi:protease complex subunit PrcB family protein [Massilia soli]|uniref:Protease complex subunit PrcB family protein n=1 Tax=Massilia soli TaxID=2792854 RepID=A0ABS7SKR1_9BURK|nr:protease complex subunit PrcB family protein [Massilia soli]MBZ2206786.1 protease complex subunit PrcB family protein [Massilia soli]